MGEMSKVPPHRCGRPGESLFEAPPVIWRLVTELLGLGPARACRSTCSRITDARNEDIAHTEQSRCKMRNTLRSLCTGLLATGALLLAGVSQAADIKDRTIKFAFVQNIDNHWGAGAEKFAETVKDKSGGKIK